MTRSLRAALLSVCFSAIGCVQPGTIDQGSDGKVGPDIQAALDDLPRAEVVSTSNAGIPDFIRGDLGTVDARLDGATAAAMLAPSLQAIAPVFRLSAADLSLRAVNADELGAVHVRYAQSKNGIEVVGGELIVHVNGAGTIYAVNGTAYDGVAISATPAIAIGAVETRARTGMPVGLAYGTPRLVYLIASGDGALHLAWEVLAEGIASQDPIRDLIYVDAHSGAVVDRHPLIHFARNRRVYSANNGTSLPGTLKRAEGAAAVADATVNAAYNNTGTTYDFYSAIFARDSWNGGGAQLTSTVHYSSSYNNAFWDGAQMVFGDGDGSTMGPLAGSLDVTAHELTHAVTQSSANLTYQNQSGALNEAMSDIMGAACEAWSQGGVNANTWKLGEDIWTPGTAGDAMRYMNNPTADGISYDYYPERYTGTSDNGGVHMNSGIANLAFKLMVTGGTHPRSKTTINVGVLGMDKAQRIFYRALTVYMTSSTNFQGARTATAQAATDLYDAATVAVVHDAWTAVGVPGAPPGGEPPPPMPPSGDTIVLTNGTGVNASGATGSIKNYSFVVPADATGLTFQLSGGTGDADLYVKFGSPPSKTVYDFRPYVNGNAETVTPAAATAGTWYLMLDGYAAYSGATLKASYTTGGGGGGGDTVVLTNGGTVTGLSGAAAAQKKFSFAVPAGATNLKFVMSGGTGDADLYVKFGAMPTLTTYDYRPWKSGNNETVTATTATAGTWYVMINGYSAYSGVSLRASYDTGGGGGGATLQNGVQLNGQAGAAGSELRWTFEVPAGATSLGFSIGNGTGDADLYVRYGAPPTTTTYDHRPYLNGNAESVTATPTAGTWHVMVRGYSAYSGLSILATFTN